MYFTGADEGETLMRYTAIKSNDLIIADRAYGTLRGISHVLKHKANFVIRLRSNSFNLYIPVRVCAVAKTEEQIEKSMQHIKKSNKGRKKFQ